ncbi:hypothetical protein DMA15_03910 [Streptomyces sp. WAC 01529]|uniref:hypothetical protein n=1 Tax=Streptomyces sp. WAC 01529 TaxID=2203205 RepID=UPI000F71E362|nr:hypothetical protein [Streptomyces sp. WAC 01529]AZM51838.1 hypothetical protein DMA15_03910 [Streptomyces sp. WAC 01529]
MTIHDLGTLNRDLTTGRFVQAFTLSYGTVNGTIVRTLPASGIERVGALAARGAERGIVWDIEVTDKNGVDVTFDFACFQD